MDKKDNKTTCMACGCPCETHKEHNHPVEEKHEKASTCSACEHKQEDGKCDCDCK